MIPRLGLVVCLLAASAWPPSARGQEPVRATALEHLELARDAFMEGQYDRVVGLTSILTHEETLGRTDRAEAWRLRGLSLYFLERPTDAESALVQYLEHEPDAHLDPALFPPDAVVFFEDVRARHAGRIALKRPRPTKRRYAALNFLPPLGQVQNNDVTGAWIVGGTGAALVGVNVTTYFMLRGNCSRSDLTCDYDASTADALRTANLLSALALVGWYAYGVYDGRRGPPTPALSTAESP